MKAKRRSQRPSRPPRVRRKKSRWLRRFWLALALVLVPFALLIGWSMLPGPGEGRRVIVEIPEGANASGIADALVKGGALRSPRLFALFVGVMHPKTPMVPGVHLVNDALSPRSLFNRLSRSMSRPTQRTTLVEGFDQVDIAKRLEEQEICPARELRRAVKDPALLSELQIAGDSAEGYLFPATYDLIVNSAAENVVRALVKTTRERLSALRAEHQVAFASLEGRGFHEREILSLASIVEKETAIPDERATVASVYLNRLENPAFEPAKMLQADPTAKYGCRIEPELAPSCRDFAGKVTPAMLRDPENRYNTYKHAGLPPGPIANPGIAAILAVVEPAKTDFLFFVAVGGGRHKFTRTLEEHNRAIEEHR